MPRSVAIFNTKKTINLDRPLDSPYWDEELVAYVVDFGRSKPKVVTSWGAPAGWSLDTVHTFHADQSGRTMGAGKIVGIVPGSLAEGVREGMVPPVALPHYVVK